MIGLDRKFAQIDALKKLGFTIKQAWILQHCLDYEFLYVEDIHNKYLSVHAVRLLVKQGHLDRHAPNRYDELHYDISDRTMKMIKGVLP